MTNNVVLYPITVALDTAPAGVKTGSTASLAITDGQATGVLEVPTAAITTVGTNHTVTVRRNGTDTTVPVGVGLTARRPPRSRAASPRVTWSCCPRPPRAPQTSNAPGAGFPSAGRRRG